MLRTEDVRNTDNTVRIIQLFDTSNGLKITEYELLHYAYTSNLSIQQSTMVFRTRVEITEVFYSR